MIHSVQKFVQSVRSNVAPKSRRLSGRRIPRIAQVLEERVLLSTTNVLSRFDLPGVPAACAGEDIWFRAALDLTGATTLTQRDIHVCERCQASRHLRPDTVIAHTRPEFRHEPIRRI